MASFTNAAPLVLSARLPTSVFRPLPASPTLAAVMFSVCAVITVPTVSSVSAPATTSVTLPAAWMPCADRPNASTAAMFKAPASWM